MQKITNHSSLITENRKSFTLIELLVVLALVAILSIVVVMTLNPAELLKQARDSNRLSDLATINTALNLFSTDVIGGFMGTSTIVYTSLVNTVNPATTTCSGMGLPTLPTGWTYNCPTSTQSLRNTDGTGWIPVNFQRISSNTPISQLPVDPTNTTTTRLYYTYTPGGSWELNASIEASKNKLGGSNDLVSKDGGSSPSQYEIGNNLNLSPIETGDSSLVGYWNFEEGPSVTSTDRSGYGNHGTWHGTSTVQERYTTGKVGQYAGSFNGVSDYINTGSSSVTNVVGGDFSISVWVKTNQVGITKGVLQRGDGAAIISSKGFQIYLGQSGVNWMSGLWDGTDGHQVSAGAGVSAEVGVWRNIISVFTLSTKKINLYIDGVLVAAPSNVLFTVPDISVQSLYLGSFNSGGGSFAGQIDDVRIYNRALLAAEVLALYNATKQLITDDQ